MNIRTARGVVKLYMKLCGFRGWASFWNTVYLMPGSEEDISLIRHEVAHLDQIERDGRFLFSLKYIYWTLRYGYWDNPYEVEARAAE